MTKIKVKQLLVALDDLKVMQQQAAKELSDALADQAIPQDASAKMMIKDCLRTLKAFEEQRQEAIKALSRV